MLRKEIKNYIMFERFLYGLLYHSIQFKLSSFLALVEIQVKEWSLMSFKTSSFLGFIEAKSNHCGTTKLAVIWTTTSNNFDWVDVRLTWSARYTTSFRLEKWEFWRFHHLRTSNQMPLANYLLYYFCNPNLHGGCFNLITWRDTKTKILPFGSVFWRGKSNTGLGSLAI